MSIYISNYNTSLFAVPHVIIINSGVSDNRNQLTAPVNKLVPNSDKLNCHHIMLISKQSKLEINYLLDLHEYFFNYCKLYEGFKKTRYKIESKSFS